ncbi:MAG: TetR/AcrR family transcriptional regulator [Bacillota bacterium]|nr:TetR/AcrR family transcriptional regulator [Bacillota bacterium]
MAQVLKEEVRNRIIDAATIDFFNSGFNNATVRNIAKLAKITPGNVYRYFESKDAIYEAVVLDGYNKLNSIIKKQIKIEIGSKPSIELLNKNIKNGINKQIESLVQEVVRVCYGDRMALLILLRDNRKNASLDIKFGMQNWFEENFDIIYGRTGISKNLAYCFTEGIINIVLEEEEDLVVKIKALVNFFFFREVDNYEK